MRSLSRLSTSAAAPAGGVPRATGWSLPAALAVGVPTVLVANVLAQISIQASCTFVLVAFVAALYVARPRAGLVALWSLWLVAPLIRRVIGLTEGYISADPLALAPFLATAVVGSVAWFRHRVDRRTLIIVALAGTGVVLGAPAGLANPLPMTFALLAYGAAVGMLLVGYQEGRAGRSSSVVTALTFLVPLVAIYGIAQYFLPLTEWDNTWLESVEFNSVGSPEDGRVRVFATLNSPGTLAAVLALAVVAILSARRLTAVKVASLAVLATALALTYVRSAWVALAAALVIFLLVGRSVAVVRVGAVLLVIAAGVPALAAVSPTATAVVDRANTLETVSSDGSGQARTATLMARLPVAITTPIGFGLGSSGEPARLGGRGGALPLDNGYLSTIEQFGPAGAVLFLIAILWAAAVLFRLARRRTELSALALVHLVLVALLLVQAYFGDVFYGITGAALFALLGWGLGAARSQVPA